MTYETLTSDVVQHFLNQQDSRPFTVIFLAKDGTQRQYTGTLDPKSKRSESIPMLTDQGWKRFDLSRVLSIQEA